MRPGEPGLLGNLGKLPEAMGGDATNSKGGWRPLARGGVSGFEGRMSAEVSRECTVERPMLRKLPWLALLALGLGLGGVTRPAQASYAGGASLRICPAPQECSGHTQYELQRQTVLRNVQETVFETQQVPYTKTVCETVMQPRTVQTVRNVVQHHVRGRRRPVPHDDLAVAVGAGADVPGRAAGRQRRGSSR